MGFFKKLFRTKTKKQSGIHSYTLGDRDEKGFCDLYVDGEKTDIRILAFTPKESKKLQDIADKLYRENNYLSEVPPARVRWYGEHVDDIFDGTVIDCDEKYYTVIPDENVDIELRWRKDECEVLR